MLISKNENTPLSAFSTFDLGHGGTALPSSFS
jgi:hypothetical protein